MNEQTFGSNFLDINNYYHPNKVYLQPAPSYTTTRSLASGLRPDAKTEMVEQGPEILVGMTADVVRARSELATVMVDDGVGNEWPWNTGADAWPGQYAYSRHYYTGGHTDYSPELTAKSNRADFATMNGLGKLDGIVPAKPRDWFAITPGTQFTPTTRISLPELMHTGFKSESLARDVLPDVRWGGDLGYTHGRFTNNGDLHQSELWETEVNWSRQEFFDSLFNQFPNVKRDDPKAYALDSYLAGKMALRQYVFHNQKGLRNLYLFAADGGTYGFGFFEPPFSRP